MRCIVAVDRNWGIGRENRLLCHIPEDLRFFKKTTLGRWLVMGRKTLESLPGGRPLPGRTTVVLTRRPDYACPGALTVHSVEELLKVLPEDREEVFVAGGEEVYRALLPLCETAYVTKIEGNFQADAFFPDLDGDPEWRCLREETVLSEKGFKLRFLVYGRIDRELPEAYNQ
ncbi:dihydrofolate reductase [Clostridiales bacterium F-3ap]|uniref:Dihydrofolate reductase n=1 Tax=Anaerotalea alkaliphila TaxID=2662126 RepID=A0A7X5KN28_9FIRM|nr:dihydrofolate reductase [Anaerotalea alkaliphila]